MQIHATNINGLGASQVVLSFLEASNEIGLLNECTIFVPETGVLSKLKLKNGKFVTFKRKLPNAISRFFECIFSNFIFSDVKTIVLGDIPLRGIKNQVVLVHQPNLIYPRINQYSSKSLNFRVSRLLFLMNHKYANKIIVQTGAMAKDMVLSYPKIKDKIVISPQPVPNWIEKTKKKHSLQKNKKQFLFYPAAFYPHKKHDFLLKVHSFCKKNNKKIENIQIWLTLNENEFKPFENIEWIKNLGRLNSIEMNNYYKKADALLFLSSMESYGLPLVEALQLNLPIISVEFEYSRWLCEDKAYYFKPYDENSFINILESFKLDVKIGNNPNYVEVIKKFPNSWEDVVIVFENALK
jgi:hypothetical protein